MAETPMSDVPNGWPRWAGGIDARMAAVEKDLAAIKKIGIGIFMLCAGALIAQLFHLLSGAQP